MLTIPIVIVWHNTAWENALFVAANDPVFINHHIDCLFEQWLMKTQTESHNKIIPRHLIQSLLVNAVWSRSTTTCSNVFNKSANDYGYSCDLRSFLVTDSHEPIQIPLLYWHYKHSTNLYKSWSRQLACFSYYAGLHGSAVPAALWTKSLTKYCNSS